MFCFSLNNLIIIIILNYHGIVTRWGKQMHRSSEKIFLWFSLENRLIPYRNMFGSAGTYRNCYLESKYLKYRTKCSLIYILHDWWWQLDSAQERRSCDQISKQNKITPHVSSLTFNHIRIVNRQKLLLELLFLMLRDGARCSLLPPSHGNHLLVKFSKSRSSTRTLTYSSPRHN